MVIEKSLPPARTPRDAQCPLAPPIEQRRGYAWRRTVVNEKNQVNQSFTCSMLRLHHRESGCRRPVGATPSCRRRSPTWRSFLPSSQASLTRRGGRRAPARIGADTAFVYG